jgi:two-component system, LytTR family, sensor kinase
VAGLKLNTDLLLAPPFKRNRIVVYLIHWAAWLVLHFIVFLPTLVNIKRIVWETFIFHHFVLVTLNFLLFYVVAFYVMPLIGNFKKKWFWILIASLLLAVIFTYLRFRIEAYHTQQLMSGLFDKFSRRPAAQDALSFFGYRFRSYFQINILTNVSIVVIAFAYRLLLIWFKQEKIRSELENQKLQAELSFLKMQVNPHFLFNALNNIYSLAVIEDSKRTGNSILKLSELIRYMIYEKEDGESKVTLDKEIHHINSYIDLEKLRHEGDTYINFSIEGDIYGKRIAPLLLFPLIENAFKHGILTEKDKPVDIDIKITGRQMRFSITNFTNADEKDSVGGIGLQNVKKRLDLIYAGKYQLDINKSDGMFNVNLQLSL